jgi:hypothetical protein
MDAMQLVLVVALSAITLVCGWNWVNEAAELRKYRKTR